MINSPTLCQKFIARSLQSLRQKYPNYILYHYMDDLLLAAPSIAKRDKFFLKIQEALRLYNLQIALEKIHKDFPISYLGTILEQHRIGPQKLQIRRDHLKTLSDFPKLLGDINWLRLVLGIPTYQLRHLFSTLKGNTALDSPRTLTPLTLQKLQFVEQRLNDGFLTYMHLNLFLLSYFIPLIPHLV